MLEALMSTNTCAYMSTLAYLNMHVWLYIRILPFLLYNKSVNIAFHQLYSYEQILLSTRHNREERGRQPVAKLLNRIRRSYFVEDASRQCTPIKHKLHLQTVRTPRMWTRADTLHGHHTNEWIVGYPTRTPSMDTIHRHTVSTAQARKHNIYGHHIHGHHVHRWMTYTWTPYAWTPHPWVDDIHMDTTSTSGWHTHGHHHSRKLHRSHGACKPTKESVRHIVLDSRKYRRHVTVPSDR